VSGQQGSKNQKVPEAAVILWDLASKQIVHVFKGLKNEVTNLSVSPDDKFIAATSYYLFYKLWGKYWVFVFYYWCWLVMRYC
jgi:hypothetical protein